MSDGAGSVWNEISGRDREPAVGIHPLRFPWFSGGYREVKVSADVVGADTSTPTDLTNSGYCGAVGLRF